MYQLWVNQYRKNYWHNKPGLLDLLCQHISGAQWQVSVPQFLQNSPIRWAAGVSSGCHHGLLWMETAVSVHWGATTISASIYTGVACSISLLNVWCIEVFSTIFSQLYQHLKKKLLGSPNIIKVKSYCVGRQQLEKFSIYADDLRHVFVSCNILSDKSYSQYSVVHLALLHVGWGTSHLYYKHKTTSSNICTMLCKRSSNLIWSMKWTIFFYIFRPITMVGSTPTMPGSS